jgi:hypothetical protein
MTKKHALIGSPSSLSRLKECPGSAAYTKDMPSPPESEYAKEGTVFHQLMDSALLAYLDGKKTFIDSTVPYEDMDEYVTSTLKQVVRMWEDFKEEHTLCKCHLELPVELTEDIYGTSDVVFVGVHKETKKTDILVLDYKYGQGVKVEAEDNIQCITYLLAAIKTLKINEEDIGIGKVIIAQVRLDDGWSVMSLNRAAMLEWEQFILAVVKVAKDIYDSMNAVESNLRPGSHCRFCKANGICVAQKDIIQRELQATMSDLPVEAFVKTLTLDEQVEIFKKKSWIEDFLDAVAKNLTTAFKMGVAHPDLKLVKSNGRRKWISDTEYVGEELKKLGVPDPYEKSIIGIGKVEEYIGKKKIDKLTMMSEGEIKLVRKEDKREEIAVSKMQELPE